MKSGCVCAIMEALYGGILKDANGSVISVYLMQSQHQKVVGVLDYRKFSLTLVMYTS